MWGSSPQIATNKESVFGLFVILWIFAILYSQPITYNHSYIFVVGICVL